MNDSNDAAPTTPSRPLADRLWELSQWIPYLGWTGLIAWGLSHRLGWGFALLLAPILGVVVWFVTGQIANSGTGSLVEINIGSGIMLGFVGLCWLWGCGQWFLTRHERWQTRCLDNLHRQSQALLMVYEADATVRNAVDLPPAERHDGREGRGHNVLFGEGGVRFVPAPTPAPRGPQSVVSR